MQNKIFKKINNKFWIIIMILNLINIIKYK